MINNNNTVDFKQLEVVRMARAIECTVRSFNNTIFLGINRFGRRKKNRTLFN